MAHEILLYDEIGYWGVTAKAFVKELNEHKDEKIVVRVNSPGGSVYDGVAIYNALKQHKKQVTAVVEGLAASAASYILCAANKIQMHENTQLMIHRAMTFAWGNCVEMREAANVLENIDQSIADVYAARCDGSSESFLDLMTAETWFKPNEAVDLGIVDAVIPNKASDDNSPSNLTRNSIDSMFFKNIPEDFLKSMNLDGEEADVPTAMARAAARMDHMKRQLGTAKAKREIEKFRQHLKDQKNGT